MYISYVSKYHAQAEVKVNELTDNELLAACLYWSAEYNRLSTKAYNIFDTKANRLTEGRKCDILFYIASTLCGIAEDKGLITEEQVKILLNL